MKRLLLISILVSLFGMEISLITKPGGKHHPHSLPNPAPIVEFILKHTAH